MGGRPTKERSRCEYERGVPHPDERAPSPISPSASISHVVVVNAAMIAVVVIVRGSGQERSSSGVVRRRPNGRGPHRQTMQPSSTFDRGQR